MTRKPRKKPVTLAAEDWQAVAYIAKRAGFPVDDLKRRGRSMLRRTIEFLQKMEAKATKTEGAEDGDFKPV